MPWQAVGYATDGSAFVEIVNGSRADAHPVKLGRSDAWYVEVVEGVTEGQHVRDRSGSRIPLHLNKKVAPSTEGATEDLTVETANELADQPSATLKEAQ